LNRVGGDGCLQEPRPRPLLLEHPRTVFLRPAEALGDRLELGGLLEKQDVLRDLDDTVAPERVASVGLQDRGEMRVFLETLEDEVRLGLPSVDVLRDLAREGPPLGRDVEDGERAVRLGPPAEERRVDVDDRSDRGALAEDPCVAGAAARVGVAVQNDAFEGDQRRLDLAKVRPEAREARGDNLVFARNALRHGEGVGRRQGARLPEHATGKLGVAFDLR